MIGLESKAMLAGMEVSTARHCQFFLGYRGARIMREHIKCNTYESIFKM
jgi:hypothetical protein